MARYSIVEVALLLADQQIWLLASGGTENVATLGDTVTAGCADAEIVGGFLRQFRAKSLAASGNGLLQNMQACWKTFLA